MKVSKVVNINKNKQYRIPYTGMGGIVIKEGYDIEDILKILLTSNSMYKPEVLEEVRAGKYEIFIEGEVILKPWEENG